MVKNLRIGLKFIIIMNFINLIYGMLYIFLQKKKIDDVLKKKLYLILHARDIFIAVIFVIVIM